MGLKIPLVMTLLIFFFRQILTLGFINFCNVDVIILMLKKHESKGSKGKNKAVYAPPKPVFVVLLYAVTSHYI